MVANYNALNEKESMSLRESQKKREKYKEEGKDKKGSQGWRKRENKKFFTKMSAKKESGSILKSLLSNFKCNK